jgi:Zn-dependent protease with chaperone function
VLQELGADGLDARHNRIEMGNQPASQAPPLSLPLRRDLVEAASSSSRELPITGDGRARPADREPRVLDRGRLQGFTSAGGVGWEFHAGAIIARAPDPGGLRCEQTLMPETLPEEIRPYTNISSKAYEHPADRAATAALKAIPMLDSLVRRLIEWRYERALRQFYLGNSIKVGERQLEELWLSHVGVCRVLDMPASYDLYVSTSMNDNAGVIGAGNPMVILGSALYQQLDPAEQRVVLAHEVGHILSDHVLYLTALDILLRAGGGLPFLLGLPWRAVKAVLLEWRRATELSSDRAATLVVRDPRIVCRTLMVTAAGLPSERLDLDAFLRQAMEYESWDDPADRVRRFFHEIGVTHSYAVRRVSEVMKWVRTGDYDRIVGGDYIRRDDERNVREEAGDAMEFYAERFRSMFQEVGDNVTRLGAQMGGMAEQMAEWVRGRGGGSGPPPEDAGP